MRKRHVVPWLYKTRPSSRIQAPIFGQTAGGSMNAFCNQHVTPLSINTRLGRTSPRTPHSRHHRAARHTISQQFSGSSDIISFVRQNARASGVGENLTAALQVNQVRRLLHHGSIKDCTCTKRTKSAHAKRDLMSVIHFCLLRVSVQNVWEDAKTRYAVAVAEQIRAMS